MLPKLLLSTNFGWELHQDGLRPVMHTITALTIQVHLPQSNEIVEQDSDVETEAEEVVEEEVNAIVYDSSMEDSDTDEDFCD